MSQEKLKAARTCRLLVLVLAVLMFHSGAAFASRAEITRPHGQPRGVVLVLHSGGWDSGDGDKWLADVRPAARRMNRRGWIAVNYSYAAGSASLRDVRAEFRRIRRRWPRLPVCAYGESSGGHLALMLAARYRTLACAITMGAPTDLFTLRGGRWLGMFPHASPARLPLRARRVLLAHLTLDWVIPVAQARDYRRHHRHRVRALYLPCVDPRTVTLEDFRTHVVLKHGLVSHAQWRRYRAAEARTLRRAAAGASARRGGA